MTSHNGDFEKKSRIRNETNDAASRSAGAKGSQGPDSDENAVLRSCIFRPQSRLEDTNDAFVSFIDVPFESYILNSYPNLADLLQEEAKPCL